MQLTPTSLPEVLLIKPDVFPDQRGYFFESYQNRKLTEKGIQCEFVQDNVSFSKKNVLRGLHFQVQQAKLVFVTYGTVCDVVVDVRQGSPNYGKWSMHILSDQNNLQLFIPSGFAHGFCVLSDVAYFAYKCSDYYDPENEIGIAWDDPTLNIDWPITDPVLSEKDVKNRLISELPLHKLPNYLSF